MLLDCSCGATNRIPGASAKLHRCGKCKHVFTPAELTRARQEPPPPKPDITADMMAIFGAGSLEDLLEGDQE